MNKKWPISLVFSVVIISILILAGAFADQKVNKTPRTLYEVFLKGKSLGIVDSKKELESYIDEKQESLKQKYKIESVYAPIGVEIKKVITYTNKVQTEEQIYNKLIDVEPFTIKGITVNISNSDEKKNITLKVLNYDIFDKAIERTEQAFVDPTKYRKYLDNAQTPIKETGTIIENIDKKENITWKEDLISVNDTIFTDDGELAKYLLFGTTEKQEEYIVQEGDTITDVAYKNKLNPEEFLIANSEFKSANSLLYPGQSVVVGLIKPVLSIVVTEHQVAHEDKNFTTEIQYDTNQPMGYEQETRSGESGKYEITRRNTYINGEFVNAEILSSRELKPSVSRIIVKGNKYVPSVADGSYWGWPTGSPYTVTSGYEYRWGSFHDAIDIITSGWGAPIYAVNNGTVHAADYNGTMGNYVIINHHYNNIYTIYMHLASRSVNSGQTVARGQKIGNMGNTGNVVPAPSASCPACGTHLHFGVWIGIPYMSGYHINPWTLYS